MSKRFSPGDPLLIPCSMLNGLGQLLDETAGTGGPGPQPFAARNSGIVLVENDSGTAVVIGGILGVDTKVIATTAAGYEATVMLSGITPTVAAHTGKFVIALEPIANGYVGKCVIAGLAQVKIDKIDAAHQWADVGPDGAANLTSGPAGAAQILWWESGTGVVCAIVRIGNPCPPAGLYGKAFKTASSAPAAAWINDSTTTGNGSYVDVHPCTDQTGTGTDTSTTIRVKLPRNGRREDPNVRVDDVICFVADAAGEYVAPSGLLDGKITETERIFRGAVANIPAGWQLCDGTNGTFDLRGRMILCIDTNGGARTDEDGIDDAGGKRLHGLTENGHPDHIDHFHLANLVSNAYAAGAAMSAPTNATNGAVISGTPSPVGINLRHGAGSDGLNAWPGALTPTYEAQAHADTDNRPLYAVRAMIARVD